MSASGTTQSTVFARTLGHANGSRHDEQVIVGRRDNDVTRTEILAVRRARILRW